MKKSKSPLVALMTDFGDVDIFVSSIKAVVLSACPTVRFLDITHAIPAHDVLTGMRSLRNISTLLPEETVVIGVVDPGVGSHRRALIVESDNRYYVGPDNGLFSPFIGSRVWHANRADYWRPVVSRTFHGRDVFAPLAAHLINGVDPSHLGIPIEDALKLNLPPARRNGSWLEGEVVSIDHFGNLCTNLRMDQIVAPGEVEAGGERVPLLEFYEQVAPGRLVALADSQGYLEIAVNQGRASDVLGLKLGSSVRRPSRALNPILRMVARHVHRVRTRFCLPGHGGGRTVPPAARRLLGRAMFRADVTQTADVDDALAVDGVFAAARERAALTWGAYSGPGFSLAVPPPACKP